MSTKKILKNIEAMHSRKKQKRE